MFLKPVIKNIMYKTLFLLVFILTPYLIFSQKEIPDFSECNYLSYTKKNVRQKTFDLVVVVRAGCDYSNDALKDLTAFIENKNLNITIYEYGDLSTIKFLHEEYFNFYTFIHANTCGYYSNDFSPVLFLYKDNELVWSKKGWNKNGVKKIQNKIKN